MPDNDDEFEIFWSVYPRRVVKKAARLAYTKARRIADASVILDGAKRYAEECRDYLPKYVAHPATWLNNERWTDEPAAMPHPKHEDPQYRAGSNGLSADDTVWRLRVGSYREHKFWNSFWGETPDHPSCYAPLAVLAEFGFRHLH